MPTTWDAWFPDVLPMVPGAPDPLIENAVRVAARAFFERTRAWVVWLDPVAVSDGVGQEIDFELPPYTELVRLEQVTKNGKPLEVQQYGQVTFDPALHEGTGQAAAPRDTVSISLTGTWVGDEEVQVQATLMPTNAAPSIDTPLASRFREAITHGAKAELLEVSGTPFYNPQLAMSFRARFDDEIASIAVRAYMGLTRKMPQRTKIRWA